MGSRTWITTGAAVAAAAAALFAMPAQAGNASIYVELGSPGHVYTQPGYVYTQPSYVYTQPSYVYTQPTYRSYGQRHHRRHRDSDRDGIPNRRDRDLDNDGVPNRWDRDVDGDGVPNRHDRRPTNPYRY